MGRSVYTSRYVCQDCSTRHRSYTAKCSQCGSFNIEEVEEHNEASFSTKNKKQGYGAGIKSSGAVAPVNAAQTLQSLKAKPISRTPTGISELDRVLGSGFVDAEVVLLAGEPGAGKSSLTLHIAEKYALMGKKVLYSSGEESEQQIGLRAQRFNIVSDNIYVINETNLERLLGYIDHVGPDLLILDSLQTIASSDVSGSMNSVSQSKEAANVLTQTAKSRGISMVLISQIVKSGEFAGSEAIQHIVDCALMLEGFPNSPLKFLRATKNRFGDTSEVGVFQHEENGLMEVVDPSGIFTDNTSDSSLPGSTCCMISEGLRALPVEVQALVSPATASFPRRQFNGVDYNRAQIICAVVDKHTKAKIAGDDVYMTTLSGVRIKDPQADLALSAALISSKTGKTAGQDTRIAYIGEVGLTGYVRGSNMIENKIAEAQRLGFDTVVIPSTHKKLKRKDFFVEIIQISHVKDLESILKHKKAQQ